MLLPWVAILFLSRRLQSTQTSGKSTPPFTPFPARVYTTDFLNSPTQEQMSFRFVSFPLTELHDKLIDTASVFPKRGESTCSMAKGVQRTADAISGNPLTRLGPRIVYSEHNIANLQDIDFISHFLTNPYEPSNEGRSVLCPLERWNNSEELLEEKGVRGSHKGNATPNKCL